MITKELNFFCFYQYYTLCAMLVLFSLKNDQLIYSLCTVLYFFNRLKRYKKPEINSVKNSKMDFAA